MIFTIAILILAAMAPSSQAHVPLTPEDNERISTASFISDMEKSWAIYGQLGKGEARYFSFHSEEGQRIYLSLLKSANAAENEFKPDMALMGIGLKTIGSIPDLLEVPTGYSAIAIEGVQSNVSFYEPFGPGSYHQLAELNMTAPQAGTYYVAVYDKDDAGHYSLAIGYREKFSLLERITTPLRLITVYQWAGQSLAFIMMPMVAAAVAGLFLIWRIPQGTAFPRAATMAGMLFIGTSATMLSQIAFNAMRVPVGSEVSISLALVLIPALLGVAALRLSRGSAGILQRIALAVVGTFALLAGSGLIIGPLLAIAASAVPPKRAES